MVHEKFIYRNGKKYGPYLYENHRVGGKVVTSYVGRTTSSFGPHVHTMPILFGGIVLLFLILASLGNYTTQYAVFEVTTVTQGVPLEGLFSFELQPGQVLLEHAEVTLVLGNASRSLPLSSVLLGTDYGNLGTRGGEITFQYRLHRVESTEESTSERVSEEEVVGIREEEILEGNTFATEEVRADESSEVAEHDEALVHLPEIEAPSDSEDSFITGQVIASEETFDGVVSASQPFIFVLGEGDLFELVMGSVQYGEETLSDDTLSLTETEQGVALRADSFFIETGYGTDYSQGTDRTFSLNLSAFHLMLQSGLLGVTLVSEGQTFVSEVTSLDFGNAPLLQLQEFPVYRALPGDIVTLSLTDYFAGIHEVAFLSSSLEGTLEGSVLSFHIPESFSGVAQGLVRMTGGDGGVTEEAFTVLVSSGVVSITTARERIVVGEPVLWTLNVSLAEAGMVTLDLPIEAKIVLVQERGGTVDEVVTGAAVVVQATGDILVDEQTVVETLGEFVSRGITGNVIAEDAVAPTVELMSTAPSSFIVTYTTPAPQAIEQSTAEGTQIVISGPETLEYTDVIASTHLDEEREGTPVLYWEDYSVVPSQLKQVEDVLNSTLLEDTILEDSLVQRTARIRVVPFDAYDLNFNGKTDYIEWVVPHLSNQTFHLIYVSFAGHYSSNGTFLEDITSQVFARDGQYTSPLAPEHIVRVTFEENLTAVNDITLFAYSLGTTSVWVLDTSTGEHVASFDSITSDRKYRVLLSGLTHPQAMFDLIISGDPLVIDQIIDPPAIIINFPQNTTYSTLPLYFNISLSENGTAWYSLNGGVTNKTMTANASRTGFNATNGSLANGQYVFRAYANDSVGNMNTTLNITFSLASPDIVAPLVTIVRPSNISYNSILYFNVSLNENGTVWYSLTNGLVNYTMSGNETLDFGTMFNATNTSIADGSYTFKAYANDTLGNYNGTSQVTFTVERVSPIVTIILPTATSYTSLPVRFNVSLNENGTAWYTLNGGLTNYTMTRNGSGTGFTDSNGTIVSGSYTFKAYANDSAGNVNYSASPVSFSVSLTSLAGTRTRSGGGSSGSVAPTATPSVSSLSLSFDKKQLDLIVKRGQRSFQTVLLKNTGNTELAVSLTINGSKPPISILNPSFTLAAGAIEQINLTVLTSDETALDVYALSLVATANGLTKLLPLIVMVKEPQALFDMSLSLEKFLVVQAGRLEILLDLLNVGDTKQADVVLEYFVQPFGGEKEKIYEDTFAVDKKQKHTSDIFLPNSLLPGEYLLSAKMTYGQSTATSAVKFSIIERSVIYLRMLLIAGLSIAIALVGLLLFVVSRTAQNAPSSSLNRPSLPLGAI
ncbi:hypothetical protein EXS73_02570 [Candidatus Pacearchaeota archaeon]|nr:hypothetical protein [Candidatus Pacearchaeota archaeon]